MLLYCSPLLNNVMLQMVLELYNLEVSGFISETNLEGGNIGLGATGSSPRSSSTPLEASLQDWDKVSA